MFSRIAVVNRGEAAMRLIHAVRDLNAQAGPGGHRIEVAALHTEAERTAMFVREADHAYDLGPASARPYLDHSALERALRRTGADAVWVGWGFVAEDPAFAELCRRIGVAFVGPSPEAMRKLGDKIGSKLIAEEVGVPVAPWSGGGVDTLEEAKAAAARVGYPLMLKATAGGGGRGIRKVTSDADLEDAYQRTRDEAERAFGSGVVFLEKLVTGARHVEVQVIADGQGTAWAIGVRDCSVQRRNQKVIEESASPLLDRAQAEELKASAERLAVAVGYAGAGTVEFLYHPGERFFAFLEVNTRLQVEHPITEVVTRTDLVRLQLHVAAGGRLEGERPREIGHAVEARLNAEDPDRDFAPAPGRIVHLELPAGPGIRVDTGVAEGDAIPADFDSMIAKIIAHGADREEALARLRRAMRETTVVIEGGATNKSFILDLLDQPEVVDGSADTGWIDRVRGEGRLVTHEHSGVALVVAGIEGYLEAEAIERTRLLETARGGRPQVQHDVGRAIDLKLRGTAYKVTVLRTGPARFRVGVAEGAGAAQVVDADVERVGPFASRVSLGGRGHRVVTAAHGPVQLVEVDGVTHRVSRDEGGVLRSPAPALVVATPVSLGEEVAAGSPVLVLESMKMETVLPAPFAARVKELLVSAGSQVETGAPLVRLEPTGEAEDAGAAETADAPDLELPAEVIDGDPSDRAERGRGELSAMLLGYDLDPDHEQRTLARYLAARDELVDLGASLVCDEIPLLTVLADFAELSRNRPMGSEAHVENRVHSPREHFRTFLQTLDPERGGLPPTSSAGWSGCSPTTGSGAPTAPPSSRRRSSGSSSPSSARPPRSRWRRPSCAAGSPSRSRSRPPTSPPATCSTGSSPPPSCATPSSATSRAACASAGSTSPSSTPTGPRCSGRSTTSSSGSTRCRRARSAPPGSTRSPPFPSGSSASSLPACARASARTSRCSRSSSSGTTAATSSRGCTRRPSTGAPSPSPTTASTSATPTWCRRRGRWTS